MKKSDLKQNMIVECRDGIRYIVLENVDSSSHHGHQDLFFMASNGFDVGDNYRENLSIEKNCAPEYDIVKIMKWKKFKGLGCLNNATSDEFEVLWERPVTIDWQPWELEVLKHIPPYFNEITRIGNGDIRIRNNSSFNAHDLRLNMPSLPAHKIKDNVWFNIDDELARYGMKREIEQ